MAVEGADALIARLGRIPQAVRDEVEKEIVRSAGEVVALAKALAPTETGTLAASIHVAPGEHQLQRKIEAGGGAAFYAKFQEYGTRKMDRNPYVGPAYRTLRKSIRNRISRAGTRAIKRAMGG